MKKSAILMFLIIIICITGIVLGVLIFHKKSDKKIAMQENKNNTQENIIDDCNDEYLMLQNTENEVEASSSEEKISPNCIITLKRYYKECGHTINEYISIPQNLVNKTEDDLRNEYLTWKIEKFSNSQIILSKEFDNNCGQHFILKTNDDKIVVSLLDENNQETFFENTNISTQYLPEEDKVQLQNGVKVNGLENLNEMLENYE